MIPESGICESYPIAIRLELDKPAYAVNELIYLDLTAVKEHLSASCRQCEIDLEIRKLDGEVIISNRLDAFKQGVTIPEVHLGTYSLQAKCKKYVLDSVDFEVAEEKQVVQATFLAKALRFSLLALDHINEGFFEDAMLTNERAAYSYIVGGNYVSACRCWLDLANVLIENNKADLAATAFENAKSLEAMSHTAIDIAKNAANIAPSAADSIQAVHTGGERPEEIVASTEEMSQPVGDVVSSTAKIAQISLQAFDQAKEGEEIEDEVQAIASPIIELVQVMQRLGERSALIGNSVSVIKDIADQTNLLALNAAIEAARAGEQGRGFAKVADEVRKLAERVGKATSEIRSMISSSQTEVDSAVIAMESTNKKVQAGLQYSLEAGEQLSKIVKSLDGLQSMVQQIASAAEEVSAVSETISSDKLEIAVGSKEISVDSGQISLVSSDLAKIATEVQSIAKQLRHKAKRH
jgi:methyl-accepting chemotaxis protein